MRYTNFCNNDDYIFSASDDKTVKVWDKVDERCIHTFRSHTVSELFIKLNTLLAILKVFGEIKPGL